MKQNKITTIIFDLSEVFLTGLKASEDHWAKQWNIKPQEVYEKIHKESLTDFFNGKISEDEFWSQIIKKHKWKIGLDEVKRIVRSNFKEIEGTREIVEKLRARGFKLGLLSVHGKEWIEHCEKKFDYHKLFHSVLYSFEISICKPDIKAFEHVIIKLNAPAKECLFIDDTEQNLVSARKLGMKTILFKNPKQLIRELKALGIKV
jgi:putative hydrolase of the HAD superfamily